MQRLEAQPSVSIQSDDDEKALKGKNDRHYNGSVRKQDPDVHEILEKEKTFNPTEIVEKFKNKVIMDSEQGIPLKVKEAKAIIDLES